MNNFDPILFDFFHTHQIIFAYYEHVPVFTVEESETIKEMISGKHTKNLFLTDKKGGFYLISIEAHKRFPINLFRKTLGIKELSFGSPEQLYGQLHLTPGSVSLFGLIYDQPATLHVYLDQDLRKAGLVGRHPNRNDATVVLEHNMIKHFLHCTGHAVQLISFDDEELQIK